MKKYIPILIITSLLLSGCSIDWNDSKDKRIAELEKQTKAISFEKQKECLWYEQNIKDAIANRLKGRIYQDNERYTHQEELFDIFYSPIKNTCLYSVLVIEKFKNWKVCKNYTVYDFLSRNQNEVWMYLGLKKDKNWDASDECDWLETELEYQKGLKELKWE